MDWYSGNGIDELIVPKDGVLWDRLPSPDSWSKWGLDGPEIFPSQYKCGAFDQKFSAEEDAFDTKSVCNNFEMEDYVHDKYPSNGSTACGDFSDESLQRPRTSSDGIDYQLDDLPGSSRMDDIFVSSWDEDLPSAENLDQSFCFSSESQLESMKFDDYERDMNLELQKALSDDLRLGSSRYLKTHAFSPSLGSEKYSSPDSEYVAHNWGKKDCPSVKGPSNRGSAPPGKNNVTGHIDDETSLESAVLLELKMISNQFSENTRICFRDALYRLAKNSNQHCLIQNQDGDLFVEVPPPSTVDGETKRSEARKSTESETNVMDRAIANLMFNKMNFNVRDRPNVAASTFFKPCPSQVHNSSDCQIVPDDTEVPTYMDSTQNLPRSENGSGNESLVLDFGSMA